MQHIWFSMRKFRLIGTLFCLVSLMLFAPIVVAADKPYTVVIDAGHGGKDPGAIGRISKEKDLNLSVALQAGKKIASLYPEVKVLYTRSTDVFLPLQSRADFVNRNNADLFICIHTNSAENRDAKGAETFVLGTEKMDANLDVAMRENAVIKLESDYQTTYQGFDPNSVDSYIMFELMQNQYMDQSLRFAELMQNQFIQVNHRVDRGVRQAAFWVLLKSACPSVLVEMGFISNRAEENYLASKVGQDSIAQAICEAFAGVYRPKVALQEMAKEMPKVEPRFAVQVLASRTPIASNDPRLQGYRCGCLEQNGWYKYYTAEAVEKQEAIKSKEQLKSKFEGCFVIALPRSNKK